MGNFFGKFIKFLHQYAAFLGLAADQLISRRAARRKQELGIA